MSFQPVIPMSGLVGWKYLERTQDAQFQAFSNNSAMSTDTKYFEENIGTINTAEELVADRRLLRVALGAFGLQDDINNKFFIKKILEEGILATDSLANKLADERYKEMTKAFGFDLSVPRSKISDFAGKIVEKYRRMQFEVAVGEQDDSMRLALNATRALPELVSQDTSDSTKWFQVMGTAALREVFETALGLPDAFSQLDLDKQLEVFQERASSQLGIENLSEVTDPNVLDKIVQRYLLRAQIDSFQSSVSSGSIALMLLQN